METKIEILLSSSSEHYERVVFMDGVEVYMDKRLQSASFPEDTDPIRNLELFLLGEKAEHRCDGCRNAGNLPCPIDNKGIGRFGKLVKFIRKFFNVRSK